VAGAVLTAHRSVACAAAWPAARFASVWTTALPAELFPCPATSSRAASGSSSSVSSMMACGQAAHREARHAPPMWRRWTTSGWRSASTAQHQHHISTSVVLIHAGGCELRQICEECEPPRMTRNVVRRRNRKTAWIHTLPLVYQRRQAKHVGANFLRPCVHTACCDTAEQHLD
jgi:hypothetical protein